MQYSVFLLSTISAAAGVLAIPTGQQSNDTSVVVTLAGASELATQTSFQKIQLGQREVQVPVGSSGPFQTVNLSVGKDVPKQNLRCQVLDEERKPIVVLRNPNVDITFSDAGKGAWTFRNESLVSAIICDPTFAALGAAANDITVILSGPDELATQTPFSLAGAEREVQAPVASSGPYNTVELLLGVGVKKQDLRCRVLDMQGNEITVKRNKNIDTTFSDAGKGAWTFLDPVESEVVAIICDPAFKAAPAA
jgi:hypothetical protein